MTTRNYVDIINKKLEGNPELAEAVRKEIEARAMTNERLEELANEMLAVCNEICGDSGQESYPVKVAKDLAHAVLQYLGKEEENIPGS